MFWLSGGLANIRKARYMAATMTTAVGLRMLRTDGVFLDIDPTPDKFDASSVLSLKCMDADLALEHFTVQCLKKVTRR